MFKIKNEIKLPDYIDFPGSEREILHYWKEYKIFEELQELRRHSNSGRFSFFDGPPFATGLPHYGHILAGTVKDIICRYATQKNFLVERRFGWDCHGLPVEHEIDQKLGIKGPNDVQKMGISAYNAECRKIVQRYSSEWRDTVEKSGRWIDFDNDYKTMYPSYMESVWWVFKNLFDKGLIYRGTKVMPFSTACCTPLSNFESTQNYKEITDVCVTVALNVVGTKNEKLLIWTTTPWTLPSNLAVCVNPKMTYVRLKPTKSIDDDTVYILSMNCIKFVFKNPKDYVIVENFLGASLRDMVYEPLFEYFSDYGKKCNAFRVLLDSYVTDDVGTGVVHQAPYFGEDDYRVCLVNGIITKSSEIICPVDSCGRFTADVPDFEGMYIKDADTPIIAKLKERGHIFRTAQINHSYPMCWRSDTPLIYKAVPSWFVKVESLTDKLIENNSRTRWVPEMIKEKRFANWLLNARDWAVSRNRYWGTPIPIWSSTSGDEIKCIGSIEELKQLTGNSTITDLHREIIDDLEIPSSILGNPPLRRVTEVFDCWFESGAMPYAHQHYPFENNETFEETFPADFVAEGIDQTRGWFYTLLVISTAIFDKPPFMNVIVNGLVLAEDGSKISKRKKNYTDPTYIMEKYGADALRLYLINSPLVKGGNLCFKDVGVKNILKTILLPWYNALRFCIINIPKDQKTKFSAIQDTASLGHIMDRWIVSYTESLVEFLETEMKAYRLYNVLPWLIKYIDQLTNWYIRLNRPRIKGNESVETQHDALNVLTYVLAQFSILMAPFAPFFSEYAYQRLVFYYDFGSKTPSSIHNHFIPLSNRMFIQPREEQIVTRMQSIIDLGRVLRERHVVPLKYPILELTVVHLNEEYFRDLESVSDIIVKELNVRRIQFTSDRHKFGASFKAVPQYQVLGQRYKNEFKALTTAIKNLNDCEIENALRQGVFQILGNNISLEEIQISYAFNSKCDVNLAATSNNDVLIIMNLNKDVEFLEEGIAREIINRIQKLKKKAKLYPDDRVLVFYGTTEQSLQEVISKYREFIYHPTQSKLEALDQMSLRQDKGDKIIEETVGINGLTITFCLYHENLKKDK